MKKFSGIFISILSVLITLLVIEGVFRLFEKNETLIFRLIDFPGRTVGLYEFDQDLGWKNRANFNEYFRWPHRTTLEKINDDGWRDNTYHYSKPSDVYRIAIIGCSLTYGYGVNMEEAYPKELERLLNKKVSKNIEVLNFGVNGYGLSQMLINYDKFVSRYNPDLVILQYYMPSVYRSNYTKMWATQKPTFKLKNGVLKLRNHPVPKDKFRPLEKWMIKNSVFYKFIKDKLLKIEELRKLEFKSQVYKNKELHRFNSEILKHLRGNIEKNNSRLIVFTLEQGSWFKKICSEAKVEVFNIYDYADLNDWEKRGAIKNPPPVGHWSPLGNQYVAEAIYQYLLKENIGGIFN